MPLAVVIPAAPGSPWLAACVASVQAQEPAAIYVVSEEAPHGLAGEGAGTSDPAAVPVTHVRARADDGFAARANRGLGAAAADGHARALLLNDDTELTPGTLARLHACEAPVCGAVLEHWEGGVQQAGLKVSRRTARVVARTVIPERVEVEALSGAALCVQLALWERLGGLDERFQFYFEDVDFCLRAAAEGAAVVLVPAARVRHRGGGTRSHASPAAAFHLGRSHALLARNLGGGLRLATVASAGAAWTVRSVGVRGLGAFARGFSQGLRVS